MEKIIFEKSDAQIKGLCLSLLVNIQKQPQTEYLRLRSTSERFVRVQAKYLNKIFQIRTHRCVSVRIITAV